jgi:hypothetical protein
MARDAMVFDGDRMPPSAQPARSFRVLASHAPARDPAHELYDRASDALHATRELAVASGTPGSAAAVVPALRCAETSLEALARAVDAMCGEVERVAPSRPVASAQDGVRAVVLHDRFAAASDAVRTACREIGAAREAIGPLSHDR